MMQITKDTLLSIDLILNLISFLYIGKIENRLICDIEKLRHLVKEQLSAYDKL